MSDVSGLDKKATLEAIAIDQQSVGKRSLHLMDTVNAEKRWATIYWRVNNFWKKVTMWLSFRLAKERISFLKIKDINDISFLERRTVIIVVL
jgi:hypothetical protein